MGDMRTVAALFHGKAVLIDFHPSVLNSGVILLPSRGLVRRLEARQATEDELLLRVHELVAQYDGLTTRLVGRSAEAIESALGGSRLSAAPALQFRTAATPGPPL